jgi:hypothetical protein
VTTNGRGSTQTAPVGGAGREAQTTSNRDGTFQFRGVIPGSYYLYASGRVSNVQLTANMRLDVGAGNIESIGVDLRQGVDVPGQIYTEGQVPEGFNARSIRVTLNPAENLPVNSVSATHGERGAFTMRDVAGARYRLSVPSQGTAYVVDAKYGGTSALTEPVQIDGGGIPLQILIGFSPGRVETVVENAGKPFAGATVVLIPNTRSRTDLYRTATSSAEGKANFANVPPGDYKLFAWEAVKQGAYQDATFMEQVEDRGHPVHVEKGGIASDTHLSVIKAVQQ